MAYYKIYNTGSGEISNIVQWNGTGSFEWPSGFDIALYTGSLSGSDQWSGSVGGVSTHAGLFFGELTGAASGSFTGSFTGSVSGSGTGSYTGSFTGLISNPLLTAYREKIVSKSVSADFPTGTVTLDASLSNIHLLHLTANITSVLFAGDPAPNELGVVVLLLKGDGTTRTINWGNEITWADGTAPTVVSASNNIDVYTFMSANTGSEWLGFENASNQSGLI